MIAVDIISKIVSKGTGKAPSTVGGESNFDLSDYLLKEIWEKVFEIKTDADGNEYIFGKLPVVTKYGITMYGEELANVPSIFDGLPIDGQTLIWKDGVLGVNPELSMGGGASSLGELLNVDASVDSTASVDRVLYQPAGSAMWTWRELPKDGVVGDYLPLSGGTITSNNNNILTLDSSHSYGGYLTFKQNGNYRGSVGYANGTDYIGNGVFLYNPVSSKYITISNSGQVQVNAQLRTIINEITGDHIIFKFLNYENSPYGLISKIYSDGNVSLQVQRESNDSELFSLILQPLGGKVGIGTNSPTSELEVNGSLLLRKSDWAAYNVERINLGSSSVGGIDDSGVYFSHTKNSITTYFYLTAGFGITINGNLLSSGGITMYSDQRKKTILNHVELSLKQIADAPLIEHYYNSDQDKTTHVGSIAQYWAQINDWFCKLDAEGFYTMEIQNCALASAISIARHLKKYESKTDKKIRILKKRVQELEDKLEKLEGGNCVSVQ